MGALDSALTGNTLFVERADKRIQMVLIRLSLRKLVASRQTIMLVLPPTESSFFLVIWTGMRTCGYIK